MLSETKQAGGRSFAAMLEELHALAAAGQDEDAELAAKLPLIRAEDARRRAALDAALGALSAERVALSAG